MCPLSMPVTMVHPEFVNGGQREGAKRSSGGWCGSPLPRYGDEDLCMKTAFSCKLNVLLGVVYVVAQTNSLLFSLFVLLIDQRGWGMAPLCPLSYTSAHCLKVPISITISTKISLCTALITGSRFVLPRVSLPVLIMCLSR